MFITLKLRHYNGQTSTCVYYTKVTTLELTNEHLCLLQQSYDTTMDKRARVYYTKVTELKWTNGHLRLLHQSCRTDMDQRWLVFIIPKLPR